MTLDQLLIRLEGVRRTAPDRAVARCPAHKDRSPSLSIRYTADGVLLVKCFANCDFGDIVQALHLNMTDLFPDRPESRYEPRKPTRPQLTPNEALTILGHEIAAVAIILDHALQFVIRSEPVPPMAIERFAIATRRINKIRGYVDHEVDPEIRRIKKGELHGQGDLPAR